MTCSVCAPAAFQALWGCDVTFVQVGILKLSNKREGWRSVVLCKKCPEERPGDEWLIEIVINSERAGEGRDEPPAFSLFSLNKDNLYKYVCIRAFGLQISLPLTPS